MTDETNDVARIAKFYRALDDVTKIHARTCGAAILAYVISPVDWTRFKLEDGETFRGVPIITDAKMQPERIRVQCANGHGNPTGLTAEVDTPTDEDLEVVSPDVKRQRELVEV